MENERKGILSKHFSKKIIKKYSKILILFLVIILAIIIGIIIRNKMQSNEQSEKYEIVTNEIEIRKNGGLSLDVTQEKYTLPVIVFNKKSEEYKKVNLKIDFYNDQGNIIKQVEQEIENLQPKEEREVSLDIGESQVLVYDYKIVDVQVEK